MKWYSKFLSCATACAALLATASLSACSDDNEGPAQGLVLTATPTTFVAGKGNTAFKVTFEGQDVTSAAEISTSGTKVENASWTTTTAGTYKFTAAYEGKTSNEVTVTVTENEGGNSEVGKYFRYVLLNKFTQVTCTYCAVAESNLRSLTPEEQEQFLTIAVHREDRLSCVEGNSFGASMGATTYPTWFFNMKKTEAYTGSDALAASILRSKLLLANSRNPSLCGVKAESTIEGTTAKVKATVDFLKAANFRIVCVLTENGLPRKPNSTETLEVFDNVLRAAANGADGKKLSLFANGQLVEVTEPGEQEFEFSVEMKDEWKKENCEFVIYVLHEQAVDKSYLMNNGTVCRVGESVDYRLAK